MTNFSAVVRAHRKITESNERFSHRLIKTRRESKLSQTKLALLVGMGLKGIHRLENEKSKKTIKILEIASVLGVCPYWLQDGDNSQCKCCTLRGTFL